MDYFQNLSPLTFATCRPGSMPDPRSFMGQHDFTNSLPFCKWNLISADVLGYLHHFENRKI
jgi:hypothetical protein